MDKTERMLSLVATWRSSGLTKKAFCREAGIKPGTFSYWVSRSRQEEKSGFAELLPDKGALAKELEVIFPNGVRIKVPSGDVHTLSRLIRLY